jgi:membrane-associated phospholipid phosphatase
VAGTAAITPADRYFAERLQNPATQANRFFRRTSTVVTNVVAPGSFVIGGLLYGVGRVAGNERMADLGLHGTEAIVVGLGATGVIKMLAGRARPYVDGDSTHDGFDFNPHSFGFGRGFRGEAYRSFPSGHTVTAFAVAAAVTKETARWWPNSAWYVGPVLYGGATLAGLSRMYDNKHWGSDVIAGAAIGVFSGWKVVQYHHSHPGNRIDRWLLAGSVRGNGRGGAAVRMVILPY